MLEVAFVRAVAEGLVAGKPAAADADAFAAAEAVGIALGIDKFDIALYAQGSVAEYSEFSSHVLVH
jgi:hypothetical protein